MTGLTRGSALIVLASLLWFDFAAGASAEELSRLLVHNKITVDAVETLFPNAGGGSGSDGIQYCHTGPYAVALTTEGHLVVNGEYFGQLPMDVETKVILGGGHVWVNGIRRQAVPFPEAVEKRFFVAEDHPESSAKMDLSPVFFLPGAPKVVARDARLFGMSGSGNNKGRSAHVGPYVIQLTSDHMLSVWGVSYGKVQADDTIDVYRDRVLVNGDVRSPSRASLEAN